MECQSTTTQSLFRSCTLKISSWLCRKAEATNSADSMNCKRDMITKQQRSSTHNSHSHHQFWCFETIANNLFIFLIFRFLCNYQMLFFSKKKKKMLVGKWNLFFILTVWKKAFHGKTNTKKKKKKNRSKWELQFQFEGIIIC